MKVAAYLRVSTQEQAEHGGGLDVQRSAIRSWAKRAGYTVALWTADEGQSGSNGLDARRGLLDALTAVQDRKAGGIVVYRLDRLARDLVIQETVLADVWKAGGRVFSTSASEDAYLDPTGAEADPSRQLIRQILGAVASYERALVRLRLTAGKVRKRADGGFIGGQVPYGWRSEGGALVPDDQEQAGLARMRELRAQGLSLRVIGERLECEGYPPKRAAHWYPKVLSGVLWRSS